MQTAEQVLETVLPSQAQAAYIHIPFCAHKCDFCDFAAFAGVDELSEEYTNVLLTEIKSRATVQPNERKLQSIFYGGGTPGYIDPALLAKVQQEVANATGIADDAEVTLETTPQSITSEKAAQWQELGINRISIGVQSFNDAELKAMGRDHSAAAALKGIETARSSGLTNIGIDLMYGLPEQTLDSWQSTLKTALALGLPHLSAYGLTIANNSPLLQRYPKDSQQYPQEEEFVHMYEALIEACSAAGLSQYEISNFAFDGYQSAHNLTYWRNEEYLAYGVSAHRYVSSNRSSNFRSLKRYMRECLVDETFERVDEQTRAQEAIFLGLRMRQGINLTAFRNKYGMELLDLSAKKITHLIDGGLLIVDNDWLRLSQSGVLVSNLVLAELI